MKIFYAVLALIFLISFIFIRFDIQQMPNLKIER